MTLRRSLVRVDGEAMQLPAGDTLPGGGGGCATEGYARYAFIMEPGVTAAALDAHLATVRGYYGYAHLIDTHTAMAAVADSPAAMAAVIDIRGGNPSGQRQALSKTAPCGFLLSP